MVILSASLLASIKLGYVFSVFDIRNSLSTSSSSISRGTDRIPPLLLNKFPELYSSLCDSCHVSLQQVYVPKAWKAANIIPIYWGKGSTGG